jgi:integrase/recombinase XerD
VTPRTTGTARTEAGERPADALDADLAAWEWHLSLERRLSPHTVSAYRSDLATHLEWLREQGVPRVERVTAELVREFLAARHESGSAPRSRLRARSALRGFYRWLLRQRRIERDPLANLERQKSARELPRVLDEEDIGRLLDACRGGAALDRRDLALLETAYGAGLRVSELVGLGSEEIDFRERWLRVRGKGDKERMVPLGGPAIDSLRQWFTLARGELLGRRRDPGCVFLNARGGPLSRVGFWKILRKRAAAAGIDPAAVHPHILRHSYATHLLRGGAPLRVVQELLGHANLATTEIYTQLDRGYLRRVHHEFHPRG